MRSVFRSFSNACPMMMVSELMNASMDRRIESSGRRALPRFSGVMPEKRVL